MTRTAHHTLAKIARVYGRNRVGSALSSEDPATQPSEGLHTLSLGTHDSHDPFGLGKRHYCPGICTNELVQCMSLGSNCNQKIFSAQSRSATADQP